MDFKFPANTDNPGTKRGHGILSYNKSGHFTCPLKPAANIYNYLNFTAVP